MTPSIILKVEGGKADADSVEGAFGSSGLQVERMAQTRGATDVLQWVLKLAGGTSRVGNMVLDQVSKELSGSNVTVQVGDRIIKVENARPGQITEILTRAQDMLADSDSD